MLRCGAESFETLRRAGHSGGAQPEAAGASEELRRAEAPHGVAGTWHLITSAAVI